MNHLLDHNDIDEINLYIGLQYYSNTSLITVLYIKSPVYRSPPLDINLSICPLLGTNIFQSMSRTEVGFKKSCQKTVYVVNKSS